MARSSEEPELEVRNLVKRYNARSTVGPISFSVSRGEFVSLLGPSGCGKTTMLRCVAGFETATEGSISLGGVRIDQIPPNRRNVGLVFQNYALFPHLTAFENVAFGLRLRRVDKAALKERVHQALELVGLREFAERRPAQLSGGQQQRVAIARSVVLEPRVLLFDEPLSNLDLKLRLQMRTELRALQQRLRKTAIYVTHDQGEALALSDRIVVMSKGKVEQVGTPREIYERPASAFVADFIGNSNILKITVLESDAVMTVVRTDEGLTLRGAPSSYRAGSPAVAVIRPEHIRMTSEGEIANANRLSASVETLAYLGQDVQLQLRVATGHSLTAVVRGLPETCGLKSRMDVVIDPRDVLLIGPS